MLRVRKSCFWVNDRHRGFLALDFTPSRIRPATRTEIIRSTPDTFLLSSLCAPLQNAFLVKLRNVFDVSASSLLFLPSLFRNFASDKRKLTSTRWHVRSFPSIPSKTLFRDTVTKHYCIFFRISLWLREFSEIFSNEKFDFPRQRNISSFQREIILLLSSTLIFMFIVPSPRSSETPCIKKIVYTQSATENRLTVQL